MRFVLLTRSDFILLCVVATSILFNGIMLYPELSIPVPSLNDDAFHFLLTQWASEAINKGENPFDHWISELELGFPQFFYYQHLPHLSVVFFHRLLLKQVDLLTLFNLIRYLLLVGFPITVFWSMKRMGFSTTAGAIGAAFSSFLSSHYGYGLEAGSFIWRGFGMYTQLWAMHLSFISLACLYRLFVEGKGYRASMIASSMLILSHLIYSYMIAIAGIVLFFYGLNQRNFRPRVIRLLMVGVSTAFITSYFWFPFLMEHSYLGASPYLQKWKYDSFGATDILKRLINGDLLDHGRFPILTILMALGILSTLITRSKLLRVTLLLFVVWLLLFFGRHTWGGLTNLLPMHEGLLFHRFIGGVHLASILLIGIGGEWLWQQLSFLQRGWRPIAIGVILMLLVVVVMKERKEFYALNKQWMERTIKALMSDQDAQAILSALKELPPGSGRVYAGLRANWGRQLKIGDLHFYDLLTFHRIEAVSPPYQSLSLSSNLIWHFNDRNLAHYDLFNVRYVVAPRGLVMPGFLHPIKETSKYILYQCETSGYVRFASVSRVVNINSQHDLLISNRDWMLSEEPAEGKFLIIKYPKGRGKETESFLTSDSQASGKIEEKWISPGRIDLKVESPQKSVIVIKMTYHPNWRVMVDHQRVQTFMVSPSFIGFEVPAGQHIVRVEYRSPVYKTILLVLSSCVIAGIIIFRRPLARFQI